MSLSPPARTLMCKFGSRPRAPRRGRFVLLVALSPSMRLQHVCAGAQRREPADPWRSMAEDVSMAAFRNWGAYAPCGCAVADPLRSNMLWQRSAAAVPTPCRLRLPRRASPFTPRMRPRGGRTAAGDAPAARQVPPPPPARQLECLAPPARLGMKPSSRPCAQARQGSAQISTSTCIAGSLLAPCVLAWGSASARHQ